MTWRQILEGLAALPVALKQLRAVKIAHLSPGDAIVLETDAPLTAQARERLTQRVRSLWPDVKVVILDSGFHMSVVHGNDATPVPIMEHLQ